MSVADYFELEERKAKAVAAQVGKAVSTWQNEAAKRGIGKTEVDRMASAFAPDDLKSTRRSTNHFSLP